MATNPLLSQFNPLTGLMQSGAGQVDPYAGDTSWSAGMDRAPTTTGATPGYYNPGAYGSSLTDIFATPGMGYSSYDTGAGGADRFSAPQATANFTSADDYAAQRAAYYKAQGLDPSQTYLMGPEVRNLQGSDRDFLHPYYKYDPTTQQADPVYAESIYRPSEWIDSGRPMVKGTGSMLASYFGGPIGGYAANKLLKPVNQNEAEAMASGNFVGSLANFGTSISNMNAGTAGAAGNQGFTTAGVVKTLPALASAVGNAQLANGGLDQPITSSTPPSLGGTLGNVLPGSGFGHLPPIVAPQPYYPKYGPSQNDRLRGLLGGYQSSENSGLARFGVGLTPGGLFGKG